MALRPPALPQTVDELMSAKLGPLLLALGKDKQQIAVCSPTTTVGEALKSMAERCTLSLPILNDPVNNKFVGFVDVMSLVRALVMYEDGSADGDEAAATERFNHAQLKTVLPQVEGSADSCVSTSLVLNATFKDALIPFTMAAKEFEWHVHRLLITTNDGRLAALFTQSDAVQMLARSPSLLASGDKTLNELGLVGRSVVMVNESTPTLQALRTLVKEKVSAIAVVNDEKQLVDILSSSDLRGMQELQYEQLSLPVRDFKRRPGSGPKPQALIVCYPTDTLQHAVQVLAGNRLHRVCICANDSLLPVGLVTLTDVLTILVSSTSPNET